MYSDGSEFNMLLEALKECKQQDATFDFVIDCAGGNSYLIGKQAEKFGLQEHVNCIGFVPREEALALQRKADCLLVFTNVDRGGFAAKIFEYMLCEKPIINIVYGDKTGSDSKTFINDLGLGIAVDEALKEHESDLLVKYMCMQMDQKRQGAPLLYEPNREKINEYDHDSIIDKVESIIVDITK